MLRLEFGAGGAMPAPALRECRKCHVTLPLDVFTKREGNPTHTCKPCRNAANRAWREANPERAREHKRRGA